MARLDEARSHRGKILRLIQDSFINDEFRMNLARFVKQTRQRGSQSRGYSGNRHERKESERFKSFTYEELIPSLPWLDHYLAAATTAPRLMHHTRFMMRRIDGRRPPLPAFFSYGVASRSAADPPSS